MVILEEHSARPIDVKSGNLRIRLAATAAEIKASQQLRYQVFCEEMTAQASREMIAAGREFDSFDEFCDHLLVLDESESESGAGAVIGTYRLMRRAAAERCGQFYSVDEYDISRLLSYPGEILELGRSCVAADHRNGTTMQLLWRGIAAYVAHHNIDIMFGCASLPGVDLEALSQPLSYLHYHHLAPPALRPRALDARYVPMDRLAPERIDTKKAWQSLPPLFKGYLRLGGFVGDGAVIDSNFGTTDVSIVVKTERVTEKYHRHYSRDESARLVSDS